MNSLAMLLATWFGCGRWPKGPGTAGSIGAFVAWPLVVSMGWPAWSFAALALALTPVAIWSAQRIASLESSKDPQIVVVDEVVGQWVSLAGIGAFDWRWAVAAFALFRLFDMWKPGPVRWLERLPGGTGIVADDLGAGVLAAVVLLLAGWLNR